MASADQEKSQWKLSASKFNPQIHLSLSDLAVNNTQAPQVISIKLKRSKTDQFMKGVKLVLGRAHNVLCPVTALLAYLAHRGDSPGPLFRWANQDPLTKTKFVDHVRKGLITANIPAHLYTGHSFRIGAATTAALMGIEDSTIQTLGKWKSLAYLLYIKLIWQYCRPPWLSAPFNWCGIYLIYICMNIMNHGSGS